MHIDTEIDLGLLSRGLRDPYPTTRNLTLYDYGNMLERKAPDMTTDEKCRVFAPIAEYAEALTMCGNECSMEIIDLVRRVKSLRIDSTFTQACDDELMDDIDRTIYGIAQAPHLDRYLTTQAYHALYMIYCSDNAADLTHQIGFAGKDKTARRLFGHLAPEITADKPLDVLAHEEAKKHYARKFGVK